MDVCTIDYIENIIVSSIIGSTINNGNSVEDFSYVITYSIGACCQSNIYIKFVRIIVTVNFLHKKFGKIVKK